MNSADAVVAMGGLHVLLEPGVLVLERYWDNHLQEHIFAAVDLCTGPAVCLFFLSSVSFIPLARFEVWAQSASHVGQ